MTDKIVPFRKCFALPPKCDVKYGYINMHIQLNNGKDRSIAYILLFHGLYLGHIYKHVLNLIQFIVKK